jgi:hypothetical protein
MVPVGSNVVSTVGTGENRVCRERLSLLCCHVVAIAA